MQARGNDFDAQVLRRTLGHFATGVTVITSVAADGRVLGITANSFSSVSLDPPLVLFSLAQRAYSLGPLRQAGCFAVNILREDQAGRADTFARALGDKWTGVDYTVWETGCPILADALAAIECRIEDVHVGGDHQIIVGRVIGVSEELHGGAEPLVFFRGAYRKLDTQTLAVGRSPDRAVS